MLTCPNCGRENPEGFQFCGYCRAELVPAATPRETRKTVTVVFTDVTGSTAMGERLDPEATRRVMSRYFDAMRTAIERHGGTVEKFIGDAVMAVFGVPELHEDDALRGVRATVDMEDALEELNKEFERDRGVRIETRTGVNTGEVVAGDPGTGQTIVTGDAVNVAARLQQGAHPGEILIGAATYRLVRDAVAVGESRRIEAKGKSDLVEAFPLIEVTAFAEGFRRRLDSPMVGRDREVRALWEAFDRSRSEQTCHLFTLLGSAGVGKSRLVEEVLQTIGDRGQTLRGRCLPYGEGITFWPVMGVVRDAAGVGEGDLPDDVRSKVAALLEGEDDRDTIADRIVEIIGAGETTAPSEEIFWAVRKFLEALGHRTPVVVVFDDIQWGEPTFLDLIEHLADWSRDAPILLLCVARPDLLDRRPTWSGGKMNATSLLLEPLTEVESTVLIENLLGQANLAEAVRTQVLAAAEGNPLFVEQMVSMLIDDGLLQRDDGPWVPAADLSRLAVPPTIQALLAARLDRLQGEERAVIERASVVGKTFYRGAIAELAPPELRPRVATHLMTLVRKELIRPDRSDFAGEEAFRFRHILIRDAAYEAMSKETRAQLHEAFAAWLEGAAGARLTQLDEIVGYHLEQAVRYRSELGPVDERVRAVADRAARILREAGRRAEGKSDFTAAAHLLERAGALLALDDPIRNEVETDLAEVLSSAGEMARASSFARAVTERARARGDRGRELHAEVVRLRNEQEVGPEGFAAEALPVAEAAIAYFGPDSDELGLARAYRLKANAFNMLASRRIQAEALERAIEHDRRAENRLAEIEDLAYLSTIYFWGPTPVRQALPRTLELLDQVRGHRLTEARIERYVAGLLGMEGRFEEARAMLDKTRQTFLELGSRFFIANTSFILGPLEMWSGRLEVAERELRAGCEALDAMGHKNALCSLAAFLAEVLYRQGRMEETQHWVDVSREAAAADDLSAQAAWRSVQAKLLARRGDLHKAADLAAESVQIMKKTDEIEHIADVLVCQAEVSLMAGDRDQAASHLREALELYREKGVLPSVERVEAMLEDLPTGT